MSVGGDRTGDMRTPPELPEQDTQQGWFTVSLPPLPLVPPEPGRRRRPLPDAVAVHRSPVPAGAPPLDTAAGPPQPAPDRAGADRAEAGQEPDRSSLDQPPDEGGRTDRQPDGPSDGRPPGPGSGRPDGGPTGPRGGPGGDGWPSQFAQVLAEALAGSRPAKQVRPWTTEQARKRIRQLGPMLQAGPRPRVRRVLTSQPSRGVVEMAVIVGIGPQTRAMAVRLERGDRGDADRKWICTALEVA